VGEGGSEATYSSLKIILTGILHHIIGPVEKTPFSHALSSFFQLQVEKRKSDVEKDGQRLDNIEEDICEGARK
jgi:hypothetical protein